MIKFRHYLCSEKYRWKEFAASHALHFTATTNRDTDEEKLKHQYFMLFVKKQIELGQITEEQSRAMITDYFLKHTTTTPKPKSKTK